MPILDTSVVQNAINTRFDKLYARNSEGRPVPYVCICCDRLISADAVQVLNKDDLKKHMKCLQVCSENKLESNPELRNCYLYEGHAEDFEPDED